MSQCRDHYNEEQYRTFITEEESHIAFDHDVDGEFDRLPAEIQNENLDHRYFQKMFEAAVEIANQYDVPLYCGEYGVIELADEKSTKRWFFRGRGRLSTKCNTYLKCCM